MSRFNSIVVRLKESAPSKQDLPASGFNSIVVRLKVKYQGDKSTVKAEFQFHSGSIKRNFVVSVRIRSQNRFNSIVVRLKASGTHVTRPPVPCFNSIVVRLKAGHAGVASSKRHRFQFHSGSIKRMARWRWLGAGIVCFNSIVVRLKAQVTKSPHYVTVAFQFHSGSIKRREQHQRLGNCSASFNSIVVRLKALGNILESRRRVFVSIP